MTQYASIMGGIMRQYGGIGLRRLMIFAACILLLAAIPVRANGALGAGARGEAVKRMQARLNELNYLADAADGIFGERTGAALAAFQRAHALPPTGTADGDTLEALYMPDAAPAPRALKKGDKGDDVAALQGRLRHYGFLAGAVDGMYGSSTQRAVKDFQHHLAEQGQAVEATGAADLGTMALLNDPNYQPYLSDLARFATGEAVRRLQARLIALGYMEGEPGGIFDEYTEAAATAFEGACGLPLTGVAGREFHALLYREDAPRSPYPVPRTLTKGDNGASVQRIQQRLIDLGMLYGVAGKQYDDAMEQALERLAEHLTALEVNWAGEFTDLRTLSVATQQRLLDGALPAYRADVGLGSKGAQALRVQRRLNALGYLLHRMVDGRFGKSSVAALKAFQQANGLKDDGKAGALTQNLLFGPDAVENKTPWRLRVSLEDQKTYAYRLGEDGEYRLERTMICSTGLLDEWTPRGVFLKTGQQEKWHYFSKYYVWGRYTYYIDGDIMFHSVLFSSRDEASVNPTSVALLGRRASHGCVRLSVEDAKWLYETCPKGTIVIVE